MFLILDVEVVFDLSVW